MKKILFIDWLNKQISSNDRIGELARQVQTAEESTEGLTTLKKWINFCQTIGLGDAAIDIAKDAWKMYLKVYPIKKLTKEKREAITYLQKAIKKIERM